MLEYVNMSSLWSESMGRHGEDLTHPFTEMMDMENFFKATVRDIANSSKYSMYKARKIFQLAIADEAIKPFGGGYMVNPKYATYVKPCTQEHEDLIELWEAL